MPTTQGYSFTGDPNVDQLILANLQQQYGASFNRARGRLGESLTSRGFGGLGGLYDAELSNLIAEQAGLEGQASTAAAMAHADRVRQQTEREQAVQNQMRLMEYQAKIGRGRGLNRTQRALLGAGTGAIAGAPFGGYGAAIGAIGGGLYGYFGPEG